MYKYTAGYTFYNNYCVMITVTIYDLSEQQVDIMTNKN